MSTTYFCVIYFLSWSFLAVTHFVILCSGYHFAEGIKQNCKEVDDFQFVYPNAVHDAAELKIHIYETGV